MIMEEFPDLLNQTTQKSILDSLYHATVGDSYRFGQVGTSNTFFPSYSNPVSHSCREHNASTQKQELRN